MYTDTVCALCTHAAPGNFLHLRSPVASVRGILARLERIRHFLETSSKERAAHLTFSPCWVSFSLGFMEQPLQGGLTATARGKAGLRSLEIL